VVVIALVVIAGAAVWFASERHYDTCIREAEAAYPVTTEEVEPSLREEYRNFDNPFLSPPDEPMTETRVVGVEERQAAIDDCSRWPF